MSEFHPVYVWYLGLSLLAGFVLVQRTVPEYPALVRLAATVPVSIVVTGWVTFGAAWAAHGLGSTDATWAGILAATAFDAAVVVVLRHELRLDAVRLTRVAAAGTAGALALAAWVMHARLSGDPLRVSLNTWGDTALHIGIARSFSEGNNFPPELPIFAGQSIRYHFGFDFYAGALDRAGMPIGLAFNVPGALAFAAIMMLVHSLARYLWRSRAVGVLAAGLFATNSSLAFLRYLEAQPSLGAAMEPATWWHHVGYDGGGPYNGDEIAIFWTLNPYLTQTHLLVAMAVVLFVSYALLRHLRGPGGLPGDAARRFASEEEAPPLPRHRAVALGALLGGSFWLNGILVVTAGVFCTVLLFVFGGRLTASALRYAAVAVVCGTAFVLGASAGSDAVRFGALGVALGASALGGDLRRSLPFLFTAGALALPQAVWLNGGAASGGSIGFHTGYLVEGFRAADPGSWAEATRYWWLNLGLVGPLILLAAALGRRADRRLLVAVTVIFVLGNLVAFGRELGGHNHKVFNLWEVLANLFAAYALVWLVRALWRGRAVAAGWTRYASRTAAVAAGGAAGVLLFASGLLDFMTLKNDSRHEVLGDRAPAVEWIRSHTDRDALFLTAYGEVYTTPTLAGRSVYLGGFGPWTAIMGYDNEPREAETARIYSAPDRASACAGLRAIGAAYVQVGPSERRKELFALNEDLFRSFATAYTDPQQTYYDVAASCRDVPAAGATAAGPG